MSENNVTPAPHQVTVEVGGRPLILETGKIAKQANGAIVARYGDTVVLTTACMAPTANDRDFLPLTVDYRENTYSAIVHRQRQKIAVVSGWRHASGGQH